MVKKIMLAAVVAVMIMGTPAFAQLGLPTTLNINLLNTDGSSIDTAQRLTIDYTGGDGLSQSINSADNAGDGSADTVFWDTYNGKSNLYSELSAKDGTDITITVNGYETLTIIAAAGGSVTGDYHLNNVTPIPSTPTTTTAPATTTTTVPATTTDPATTTTTVPATTTTLPQGNSGIERQSGNGAQSTAGEVSVKNEEVLMTAPSIRPGSSVTFTVPLSEETPMRQLVLKVDNEVKDVEVTVSVLTEKPAHVGADTGGTTYRYIDISHTVDDAEINSATITFNVEKSWIHENNIDPDSVTLDRYSGGKWTVLATTRLRRGPDYYTYEAASPGLSVFRISGSVATGAPATVTPAKTPGIGTPVTTVPPRSEKSSGKVLFIVPALVIVALAVYYYRKR